MLSEVLLSPGALILDYFEPDSMRKELAGGNFVNIWLLLVLEHWLQAFRNRHQPAAASPESSISLPT